MKAIILAAGHGTRMRTKTQKVMHPILGKPIVQYVTDACIGAGIEDITLVVSGESDDMRAALPGFNYAVQTERLGTGHAVQAAAGFIKPEDDVLVIAGDMPLITSDFIREFAEFYTAKACSSVVSAVYMPNAGDFGRVYVGENGAFEAIVEARDLLPDSPLTNWANTSIYLFKGAALLNGLSQISNSNSQGEYYLTDVPKILRDAGHRVYAFQSRDDVSNFTGINTQAQLAEAAQLMRMRINLRHMSSGVRMLDPATTYIDDTVKIAPNVVIYPGCILEGACEIGEDSIIGPYTHMKNTKVSKAAAIRQSVLSDSTIGEGTTVGPFAYLRASAVIGKKCRIGNFVEIKNANLSDGVKMAHLAYIGDADVGRNVNYSCGAITANYDGKNKHRTVIEDGVFVGCNANLVAPLTIGAGALIAAGSTVTEAVPAECLTIARARQVNKEGRAKKRTE